MKFLKPIFTKIAKNKQTTGLGHVTIGDIKQLNVVIPDMMNQRQIVSVLKPIDDKITLNNAINCNLYLLVLLITILIWIRLSRRSSAWARGCHVFWITLGFQLC